MTLAAPSSRPGRAKVLAGAPDLAEYATKRRKGKTPEPMPTGRPRRTRRRSGVPSFVIQEHRASSLHWDFRLERDGVLVSWALPKGLPRDPDVNHLAVPTEDHPLEYGDFAGTIPAGQYGGGEVTIWDHGTYECEKWTDKEVMVVLHGDRVDGRYVLFPTGGKRWMIHRMDARAAGDEPTPEHLSPMLATAGPLAVGRRDEWAYEFKWDGVTGRRAGRGRAADRHHPERQRHHPGSLPELRPMAEAFGSRPALLDGELIVLGEDGVPSFPRVAATGQGVRNGRRPGPGPRVVHRLRSTPPRRSVAPPPIPTTSGDGCSKPHCRPATRGRPRRRSPESREPTCCGAPSTWAWKAWWPNGGPAPTCPGRRSPDWIKTKLERTQEVVVGGWTPGEGSRERDLRCPGTRACPLEPAAPGHSRSSARSGPGSTRTPARQLIAAMRRLNRATPPFDPAPPPAVGRTCHLGSSR